jgi:ATP-dependent DNA helicase RecG
MSESAKQLKFQFSYRQEKPTALLTVQEIYAQANEDLLERLGEDRRVERKPAGIHSADLAKCFSMFANTKPDGGIIIVGMENDGAITGCARLSRDKLNSLERTGDTYCPDAKHETRRLAVARGDGTTDFLLLFRVFYREDKVVATVSGDAYVRSGDSKKKLTSEHVRELQLDKGEVDLELEPCTILRYPEDYDAVLIGQFTDEFRRIRGLETPQSNEAVLVLRHLGRFEGKTFVPNVACCLLFAKDPAPLVPGCKLRFLRFEGEREGSGEEFNPIKDISIEGNIPTQIASADNVLKSQLRDFSRLGPDGKFYTAEEYPPMAWYEAIVNACVHRSYGIRNMNTFIKMFDDRLVIESPGGFPGLVTPKNIYDMHHPRNPHLMDAMFYLKFVRCAHEGTRRIRDSMLKLSLPAPEFAQKEVSHSLVRVTLRNNIKQRKVWIDSDASAIVGEALSKVLSEHERRAINFLAENGTINVSQVQRLTRGSWPASKKLLERLTTMGIAKHHKRENLDRDPQAYYSLNQSDNE